MPLARRSLLLAVLALATTGMAASVSPAIAASASQLAAAEVPVQKLDAALLDVMKNGASLRFEGRFNELQPVIASVFDVPEMTRIAVGPLWSKLSDSDRAAAIEVFGRYMTTMYAARFKSFSGESFDLVDAKPRDGGAVLVATKLKRKDKDPVDLSYLLHGEGDQWHIVDVYYNGAISQMAQLRSEFTAPLRNGGIDNLRSVLEAKIKDLQGGA